MKLLPREDGHPALFDAYEAALRALAHGAADAPELRRFEKILLREIGYGLSLDEDSDGKPINPQGRYLYLVERGAVEARGDEGVQPLAGKTLLDMAADDYTDARTQAESKALMRQLIAHHLSGQSLQSRRVFIELQEL
jgi:DNA repair protein RecO (recombination protein O)